MFDRDLFLKLCKEYGVPLSSDYAVPMLKENGIVKELAPSDLQRILSPVDEVFEYTETPYSFKLPAPKKVDILADDLLAA